MVESARRHVLAALEACGAQTPENAIYVAEHLDNAWCAKIVREFVFSTQRVLLRRPLAADPRQGWLALPEYQHVPPEVAHETMEQLGTRIANLEKRISSYDYPRRSLEKKKADLAELRELKRIRRQITRPVAGAPEMSIDAAMEIRARYEETPRAKRDRKGGKARQSLPRKINNLG